MERWFNILKEDFYSQQDSVDNILNYYKYASTCYAITEYIFKKDHDGREKEKQQLLNKLYETELDFIYDKKYHFNHLKHMNHYADWNSLIDLDFSSLVENLFSDTNNLIERFNVRFVLNNKDSYITSYLENYSTQYTVTTKINSEYINYYKYLSNTISQYNNIYENLNRTISQYSGFYANLNDSIYRYNNFYTNLNNVVSQYSNMYTNLNNAVSQYSNVYTNLNKTITQYIDFHANLNRCLSQYSGFYANLSSEIEQIDDPHSQQISDLDDGIE